MAKYNDNGIDESAIKELMEKRAKANKKSGRRVFTRLAGFFGGLAALFGVSQAIPKELGEPANKDVKAAESLDNTRTSVSSQEEIDKMADDIINDRKVGATEKSESSREDELFGKDDNTIHSVNAKIHDNSKENYVIDEMNNETQKVEPKVQETVETNVTPTQPQNVEQTQPTVAPSQQEVVNNVASATEAITNEAPKEITLESLSVKWISGRVMDKNGYPQNSDVVVTAVLSDGTNLTNPAGWTWVNPVDVTNSNGKNGWFNVAYTYNGKTLYADCHAMISGKEQGRNDSVDFTSGDRIDLEQSGNLVGGDYTEKFEEQKKQEQEEASKVEEANKEKGESSLDIVVEETPTEPSTESVNSTESPTEPSVETTIPVETPTESSVEVQVPEVGEYVPDVPAEPVESSTAVEEVNVEVDFDAFSDFGDGTNQEAGQSIEESSAPEEETTIEVVSELGGLSDLVTSYEEMANEYSEYIEAGTTEVEEQSKDNNEPQI